MAECDKNLGLYNKYHVDRTDGSDCPGGKHEHCDTFTLDITHDPNARVALRAYADSCRLEYPHLAADLVKLLRKYGVECK